MNINNTTAVVDLSELHIELASMERVVCNLRKKIAKIERRKTVEKETECESENFAEVLGKRMKAERELRGYNFFQVSKKSGLRYETIQGLEEGKGTIKNFIKYGLSLGLFFCFLPSSKY